MTDEERRVLNTGLLRWGRPSGHRRVVVGLLASVAVAALVACGGESTEVLGQTGRYAGVHRNNGA